MMVTGPIGPDLRREAVGQVDYHLFKINKSPPENTENIASAKSTARRWLTSAQDQNGMNSPRAKVIRCSSGSVAKLRLRGALNRDSVVFERGGFSIYYEMIEARFRRGALWWRHRPCATMAALSVGKSLFTGVL